MLYDFKTKVPVMLSFFDDYDWDIDELVEIKWTLSISIKDSMVTNMFIDIPDQKFTASVNKVHLVEETETLCEEKFHIRNAVSEGDTSIGKMLSTNLKPKSLEFDNGVWTVSF